MSGAAQTSRDVQRLMKGVAARLGGRGRRGPDVGEGRRVPRRNSVLESDPAAQPWARIEDGSVAAGLAHREAMIRTAEELRVTQWKEVPLAEVRQARTEHAAAVAELEELATRSPAEVPVGRPATLHQQIASLRAKLHLADRRLTRTDITVLQALLSFLDFKSGRLFPSIESIAEKAGCHRNSAIAALRRLKVNGFIDWVRRTIRTGNEGEFAPQLEQTSNAYFFDNRRRMAKRTWARFTQLLVARLRRLGRTPPDQRPDVPTAPDAAPAPGSMAEALASFGSALARAST